MASPSTPTDSLSPDTDSESSLESVCSTDDLTFRKILAEFVILDDHPYWIVEKPGFRCLFGDRVLPSRIDVYRDIVKIFKEEKEKLKKVVKLHRISVTTSVWTTIHELYYMCVTAHWIDDSWASQKRIIGFLLIPDFTKDTVAEELENCFKEWGITQLQTVTMDNALSNDSTIDLLKEKLKEEKAATVLEGGVLHMTCACDIINSIVEAGLKELAPSIARIRNALVCITCARYSEIFKECIAAEGIESKSKLSLDIETMWDTTYKMLDGALAYKRAFDRMKDNAGYRNYFDDAEREAPADSDWENAESFVHYLEPLYNLAVSLSVGLSPNSNLCFSYICEVKKKLVILSEDANDVMRQMAVKMDAKFVEHWGNPEKINRVLFLAMVLDPRYKMDYLEHCLGSMYEAEAVKKLLKEVKASLYKLFDEYNDAAQPLCLQPTSSFPKQSNVPTGLLCSFIDKMRAREGSPENEVDRYLSEYRENILADDFDVLAWWRSNANKYKVLSRIAKDVLAVSVSSLSPDSVFTVGGRFLNPYKSALSYTTLEVVVCAKSWLTPHANINRIEFNIDDLRSILCGEEYDDIDLIEEEPMEEEDEEPMEED